MNWRVQYMAASGEFFLDSLRSILHSLAINTMVQVSTGLSLYGYRGLDVITKLLEWGKPLPRRSAWDIAFTALYPHERQEPSPDMWWRCMVRIATGMRDNWADWHMTDLNALNNLCVRYVQNGPQELQNLAVEFHHDRITGYKVLTTIHQLLSGHMSVSPSQLQPLDELLHRLQTPLLYRAIEDSNVQAVILQDAIRRSRL
jgi:hypothetical protein